MNTTRMVVGSVASLWQYPVKSMLGEEVNASEITTGDHRDTVTDFGLPEGTFFDCAFAHLVTTATLDRLRDLYPQGRFDL